MLVGFYQFSPRFGKVSQNLDRVSSRLNRVEADLLVLPEFFATGYQFQSKKEVAELSEEIPTGPTTRRLLGIARDRGIWIVAGLVERDRQSFYNSAVLVGPKGTIGTYRKAHLFDEEKRWFRPGNTGFIVYRMAKVRLGIIICFDWIFPEAIRLLSIAGAEIIAHPANLVLPYCPDAMVTRCIENGVFAVTANRVGSEKRGGRSRLSYIGRSQVVDPQGRIRTRAPSKGETLSVVEINPKAARTKTINSRNHLFQDRRMDLYGDLL